MWPLGGDAAVDWEFRVADALPRYRSGADVLWASERRLPGGAPVQRIRANRRLTRVHVEFSEVCEFLLTPRRTWVEVLDPAYRFMVEIRLLGYILGIRHELNGTAMLHAASLVAPSGEGIVVVGEKGAGKSMFTLNALRAGWRMAGDDISPLAIDHQGRFVVLPSYPQLRLWGRDVAALGLGAGDVVHIHPEVDKKGVPLDRIGGRFHPEPAPVAMVVLLSQDESGSSAAPKISIVPPSEAVFALSGNVFLRHLTIPLGWQRRHFEIFSRLASQVPVVRVPSVLAKCGTAGIIEHLPDLIQRRARRVCA